MTKSHCDSGKGFAGNILALGSKEQLLVNKKQLSTCFSKLVNIYFKKSSRIASTNCIFGTDIYFKGFFCCFDNCQQIVGSPYYFDDKYWKKKRTLLISNLKLGNIMFRLVGRLGMEKAFTASPLQSQTTHNSSHTRWFQLY